MVLTEVQHITQELAEQLQAADIRTVAELRRASDERVLSVTTATGRVLKRIRLALEKLPPDAAGFTRWEWPDNPFGKMLLWRGGRASTPQGSATPDVFAQFKAGYYYTSDEDEIAVLQKRADTRKDIYQVSMDAEAPRHAPSAANVPTAPSEVNVPVNTEYLQKGE